MLIRLLLPMPAHATQLEAWRICWEDDEMRVLTASWTYTSVARDLPGIWVES